MSSHSPSSPSDRRTSSDDIRRTLYETLADDDLSLSAKMHEGLALGRDYLGVQNGHVERAQPAADTHEIVASVGGPDDLLPTGATLDRATTYCRRTMAASSPLALANAPEEGWADDPAYDEHGFDCYLGAPIYVRGEPYGTVCFVDESPREEPFAADETMFVELLARLFGRELDADGFRDDLSEARERRETLLEAAPNAIFLAAADTRTITDVNEAAARLSGYDVSTLEGMNVLDLHPAPEREQYRRLFAEVGPDTTTRSTLQDGSRLELLTADGERVPVELSATTVELGDGRYVQGIVRDVSERVAREAELARERELFAYSQRLASVGGWEYDCRSGDLYWTEEVRRIHGVAEDYTPTVETALDFYHPADRATVADAIDRAVESGEAFDVEVRLRTADGDERWVRAQGQPTLVDGETVRLRGTFQDITERTEREEQLRLRSRAMDEAGVGISIADATGADTPLVYVNDAFTELTGYGRETVLGANCRFLQGPNTDPDSVDVVRAAIEAEETRTTELLNYRADGTPFWNELTMTPVADADGATSHFIGIQRDVTNRKRGERLVGVLNRLLRHNLRNDMTVVAGLGETIAEGTEGEVAAAAETVTETARDLVAVSEKAQTVETALREDPPPGPMDVADVVETTVRDLRERYPRATVRCDVPGDQQAVATDRLRDVLVELVGNAVAAGGPDPTVTVSVQPPAGEADRVRVQVSDDGPGMPPTEMRVLRQASESALDHGSSFGLWLVNWLVTEMGGTVDVAVDDGTTVTVTLQREGADPDAVVSRAALGDDPDSAGW